MKWTYIIKNKLLASVILLTLCLLVLLSNYLDRVHARNVSNSISTLYEDRLLAEEYILKMTSSIYEIRELLNSDQSETSRSKNIQSLTDSFNKAYQAYSKTKLTKSEKENSVQLIDHFKKLEQSFEKQDFSPSVDTKKALASLKKLSTDQLDESKLIMKNVEAEYASIRVSSQFAVAVTIIILLVLQTLVFSSKTLIRTEQPGDSSFN